MENKAQQLLDNLEGAELNIYLNDGGVFSMSLSNCQLAIALSVLGFRMIDEETYKVLSDETLVTKIAPRLPRLEQA